MSWHGDVALESTFDIKFTTRRFTTGIPFALASGVISAYPANSTTQLTAGITLTADFDGVTGLNNVRVVATAANGYATATDYALVITTGTVDSVSVVGEVVAAFSIQARSNLRPTVAGRTLDVSATGEAGMDWANIGAPTTSQTLSGTTVGTATAVTTVNGLAANVITATSIATGALTAAKAAAGFFDAVWTVTTRALTDKVNFALSAAGIQAIWDALTSALTTAGSVGKRIADNLDATVSTRAPEAGGNLATVLADTNDIQTRLPATLSSGRMRADLEAIGAATGGVAGFDRSARTIALFTVGAASTETSIVTSSLVPAATVTDQFKGRIVIFDKDTTTAALRGQAVRITASTSGGVLTCTTLTTAPVSGDTGAIL